MSKPVSLQTVIEYVEALSTEEQDLLLELIYKRRVEQRRKEIASNAAQTLEAIRTGTAKRGTLANLRADLLSDEWERLSFTAQIRNAALLKNFSILCLAIRLVIRPEPLSRTQCRDAPWRVFTHVIFYTSTLTEPYCSICEIKNTGRLEIAATQTKPASAG